MTYSIRDGDGQLLGNVVDFPKQPSARRWVAYAVFPADRAPGVENKAFFKTLKEASVWLKRQRNMEAAE